MLLFFLAKLHALLRYYRVLLAVEPSELNLSTMVTPWSMAIVDSAKAGVVAHHGEAVRNNIEGQEREKIGWSARSTSDWKLAAAPEGGEISGGRCWREPLSG
jgi:hypothetical protein